jgi:predicted CoA-binding protein
MFTNPTDEKIIVLLKNAGRIAIVGLSPKIDRESNRVGRYLRKQGYEIIPVNPVYSEVLGEKSYPDLESVPGKIDIVDVFRKPEAVPAVAETAVRIGAGAIWFQQGVVNEEAADFAARAGMTVVMDLCMYMEHLRLINGRN